MEYAIFNISLPQLVKMAKINANEYALCIVQQQNSASSITIATTASLIR